MQALVADSGSVPNEGLIATLLRSLYERRIFNAATELFVERSSVVKMSNSNAGRGVLFAIAIASVMWQA